MWVCMYHWCNSMNSTLLYEGLPWAEMKYVHMNCNWPTYWSVVKYCSCISFQKEFFQLKEIEKIASKEKGIS